MLPRAHARAASIELIDDIAARDIFDAQERYILLFDRTRSLSLHLFEHVHGESRDRGQAMVDLLKLYEDAGYSATASELPDFLPLFLEFASTRDAGGCTSSWSDSLATSSRHCANGWRSGSRPTRPCSLRSSRLSQASSSMQRSSRRCAPSPIPSPTISRRSMPPGPTRRFASVPAAADDCGRDSLVAKLRHAHRPAPGTEPPIAGRAAYDRHPFRVRHRA